MDTATVGKEHSRIILINSKSLGIFGGNAKKCEEFADSVCDEFFSLPLFPQAVCDEDALRARNVSCTCGNYASSTGLGCATTAAGMGCAGTCGCKC